jgi:hypothetical protein
MRAMNAIYAMFGALLGQGHVSVSTLPGKFVVVDITGRTDALGTDGPFANGCLVSLGLPAHPRSWRRVGHDGWL